MVRHRGGGYLLPPPLRRRVRVGDLTERMTNWSTLNNPFFAGPRSDLLSMIPFVLLIVLLYLVGREALLRPEVR